MFKKREMRKIFVDAGYASSLEDAKIVEEYLAGAIEAILDYMPPNEHVRIGSLHIYKDFIPEHEKTFNLTGEKIVVADKIVYKAKIEK